MSDKTENRIITSAKEALSIVKTQVDMKKARELHNEWMKDSKYRVEYEDGQEVKIFPPNSDVCRRLDEAFRNWTFFDLVGIIPTNKPPID